MGHCARVHAGAGLSLFGDRIGAVSVITGSAAAGATTKLVDFSTGLVVDSEPCGSFLSSAASDGGGGRSVTGTVPG